MIICPSCGSNVKADLCLGCRFCGARAVGPPLAKAEFQLPSFGRGAVTFAAGVAMVGSFTGFLIASLIENKSTWLDFWAIVSAGEVAAWRVKWAALPISVAVLWSSVRIVRSIKEQPARFIGLRMARAGLSSAAVITVLIATLIGITIPERLQQRRFRIEAANKAPGNTLARAMLEYRELHGMLPPEPDRYIEALRTLPDPDGSIAEALQVVDPAGYHPTSVVASTKTNPLSVRVGALRNSPNASLAIDNAVVSFTNYELRLPGEDKLPNTDDDIIVKDGLVITVPEYESYTSSHKRVP